MEILVWLTDKFNIINRSLISCRKNLILEKEHKDKFDCKNLGDLYFNTKYTQNIGIEPDYSSALEYYTLAANLGITDAYIKHNIGCIYYSNQFGVENNYTEAFKWFKKAFIQGYKDSAYYLAILYLKGNGIEQNIDKSIKLFKLRAENDNCVKSQYNLGMIYHHGYDLTNDSKGNINYKIEPDIEESIKWYKLASDNGCSKASRNLARIFLSSTDSDEEYVELGYSLE